MPYILKTGESEPGGEYLPRAEENVEYAIYRANKQFSAQVLS